MRVVVIGISGAGKTTLAARIAARLHLTHIELDAINCQPEGYDLSQHDPAELIRRVRIAISADEWVLDGSYSAVRTMIWQRATHLIWLDYACHTIILRVIRRLLVRTMMRTKAWLGFVNRRKWSRLLRQSHPIRWAWSYWSRRRHETAEQLGATGFEHLAVLQLNDPGDAWQAVEQFLARPQHKKRTPELAGLTAETTSHPV